MDRKIFFLVVFFFVTLTVLSGEQKAVSMSIDANNDLILWDSAEIVFYEDSLFEINNVATGLSIPVFGMYRTGRYEFRKGDVYHYLLLEISDEAVLETVVFFTEDSIIIADPKSDEQLLCSGSSTQPPIDLLPHLRPFIRIESSSFLKERVGGNIIEYRPENLLNWYIQQPWVEGAADDGIGESITVYSADPTRAIVIANGFISGFSEELYTANGRIKKLSVRAYNPLTQEVYHTKWFLHDTPNFQTLILPQPYMEFELKIDEIYPGAQFSDTSISAIFTHIGLGMYQRFYGEASIYSSDLVDIFFH